MTELTSPPLRITPLDPARPEHAQALVELLDAYARDPMGGGVALSAEARENLSRRLSARSDYAGFLAWSGDRAIGLINCFEGFSTFAARPLLNIHDIAVHPAHRGKGAGAALLAAAESLARERGCCKLTLEVLSGNTGAHALYTRVGFEAYQLDPEAGQALFMQKKL